MSQAPFFTIVMPVYNPPDLIFRTLDSVFAQTFKGFELIVVDDCSPRDVRQLLAKNIDAGQIRYVRNPQNSERAVSRNRGMLEARGQWVTFLDHDDILYPECLQKAFDFTQKHPDIAFFHNLNEIVGVDGQKFSRWSVPLTDNPAWDIVNGNFLACNGTYIRRAVFEKVTFDENKNLLLSEDYEYWLRVLAYTKHLGRIPEVLSAIVDHPARSVYRVDLAKVETRARYVVEKATSSPEFRFFSPRYLRRLVAIRWMMVAIAHCSAGSFSGSARYLRKAISADFSLLWNMLWIRSVLRLIVFWWRGVYAEREKKIRAVIAGEPDLQTWQGHLDVRIPELREASAAFADHSIGEMLEIGCGNGLAAAWFSVDAKSIQAMDLPDADHGAHAIGLERTRRFLRAMGVGNVELVGGSAEKIPFSDNSFDSVAGFFVLEHVPSKKKAAEECYRVMRPGAVAVFHVPAAAWSLVFFPAFYRETLARIFGKVLRISKNKLFPSPATKSPPPEFEKVKDVKSFRRLYPNFPLPEPHGAYGSWLEELWMHRSSVWVRHFHRFSKVEVRAISVLPMGLFTVILGRSLGVKMFRIFTPIDRILCLLPGARHIAQFLEIRVVK